MALKFFANIGNDTTPDWVELAHDDGVFATGAGSSPTLAHPIMRPETGYVWNEEMWIGPAAFIGGKKVNNWCKPSAATQNAKVFKIEFPADCIAAPVLSAFDDDGFSTWDKGILQGTKISKFKSLLKAHITGREISPVTPPANWTYCDSGHVGSANPNALRGNETFCVVPFVPLAGEDVIFTMALAVPADAEYGRDGKYDPVITITFITV
jgi:hypothetical protein